MTGTPIEALPATSALTIRRLKGIGINTFEDFVRYYPTRYISYEQAPSIAGAFAGKPIAVRGIITEFTNQYTRRHFVIQKATLQDKTGTLQLTWFNQPYFARILQLNTPLIVAGIVEQSGRGLLMKPEEWEIPKGDLPPLHTGIRVPIYPEKRGLSSRLIREKIFLILHNQLHLDIEEFLPEEMLRKHSLIPLEKAVKTIHFPENQAVLNTAKRRLAFDELFLLQLSTRIIKQKWQELKTGHQFAFTLAIEKKLKQFIDVLPFQLTSAQKKVTHDILDDLKKTYPMNRFLQGDVGSGKTVVAAIASYATHLQKLKTLYMAPTEILAIQHAATFKQLFAKTKVSIALHTGSVKELHKKDAHIIIGTHALINKTNFSDIGLVIIDEQHRFGVVQRQSLQEKSNHPHVLTMTATPIPRTMALTIYGHLSMSVIDEMPQGRMPIKTWLVPHAKRLKGYEWIRNKVEKEKQQAFIICPLIEESEKETLQSVKTATTEYEYLAYKVFPTLRVALLHGKMKPEDKNDIMKKMEKGFIDILVSTSVVEVGIDIKNATIMVIEGAERFGLAQLHQLRGRVGRNDVQSFCLLFTTHEQTEATTRLQYFAHHQSGLEVAQFDLETRGAGNLYGTEQHGLDDMKIATLMDAPLIEETGKAANTFLDTKRVEDFHLLKKELDRLHSLNIAKN